MKKKPTKITSPCLATASGGALKCQLERGHTGQHSTATPGRKASQHATWIANEQGTVAVTTYSHGKKMSDWTEDGPPPPKPVEDKRLAAASAALTDTGYCGQKFESYTSSDVCTRTAGHDGLHENTSTGIREWRDEQDDEGDAAAVASANLDPVDDDDEPEHWRLEAGQEDNDEHAVEIEGPNVPAAAPPLTKIGDHEVHPAAALFPMIAETEWPAFLDDIRTNGQRRPIVRIGKLILDGRNRLRACIEIGREPTFRAFGDEVSDGADPIAFVVSENIHRRHLNETQRAFVGAELVPMYEAQAKERQREGGRAKGQANLPEAQTGQARDHAARAVNVSPRSIEAALKVKRDAAPEVLEAARDRGQVKVSTAAQLATLPKEKQREIVEKIGGGELRSGKVRAYINQEKKRAVVRKINEQRIEPMPTALFGVIYGDYPWHYDNSDQHEGSRGHLGYPTMTMEQVLAHAAVATQRAAKDSIVALWSTNLYLTKMERVIEAYGAVVRTVYTWPKPKFGVGTWGRGQTEHLVIGSVGSPVHTLNEVSTLLPGWLPAHPGEHSSKPRQVAELLQKHCGGPFLELFAREQRSGWICWGAEADKFATEAA